MSDDASPSATSSSPLLALPDDCLALVMGSATLGVEDLRSVACAGRLSNRDGFWYAMAARHGVSLPRAGSKFATRSKRDLRSAFFLSWKAQRAQRALLADKLVWDLWLRFHKADAAAAVAKVLREQAWLDVGHQLSFYHGATLLHLAARRGRLRCVKLLLAAGADRDGLDAGGFTPLAMAAWSNRANVVAHLLERGADVRPRGIPPCTSSCGGRGPHTAEEWAARKGFDAIAGAIRKAAARS